VCGGVLIGLTGWIVFIIGLNFVGTKVSILSTFNAWDKNHNLFLVVIAIFLFHIFRKININNNFINNVSSLSLMVYVIHGNPLVIKYIVSSLWHLVYIKYGHMFDILWTIVLAIVFFVISIMLGSLYLKIVQPLVRRLYNVVLNVWSFRWG
jgi:hypothetical protein